jgi:Arc/MetJ-type ribon-helix-helix transcriptional regulator
MSKMITVRLSEERMRRLDKLVSDNAYPSRAAAVTDAIDRLLREEEERALDRAIVEGYTRVPPTPDEEAWAEWSTHESIREDPW